jgi:hypothetical protein
MKSNCAKSCAGQLDRLIDDALVLFGIAQLDIAGEREVLAERMALEAIVGEDAAQVRVAGKDHAVHVEHFAFEPAGDRPQRGDGRHRSGFLGGGDLDHDAVVLRQREQHVDTSKRSARSGNPPRRFPSAAGIRARRAAGAAHPRRFRAPRSARSRHALPWRRPFNQHVAQRLADSVSSTPSLLERIWGRNERRSSDQRSQRSSVPTRRIFRCNCITP